MVFTSWWTLQTTTDSQQWMVSFSTSPCPGGPLGLHKGQHTVGRHLIVCVPLFLRHVLLATPAENDITHDGEHGHNRHHPENRRNLTVGVRGSLGEHLLAIL